MNKKTALIFSMAFAFVLVLSLAVLMQAEETIKCPVSGETFNKSDDTESFVYKGKTYYFCCPGCKESFVKDPEKYIKALEEGKEAPGHEHACACESHDQEEHQQAAESLAHADHTEMAETHAHAEHAHATAEHAEHTAAEGVVTCAVMGHEIKDIKKAPKYEYEGKTYYFCCPGCIDQFKADPEKYIKK